MTTDELRAKFIRKAHLSEDHHDALTQLVATDPVVFYEMGTEEPIR